MVVTPEQARRGRELNEAEKTTLHDLEKRIDASLLENGEGISVQIPGNLNRHLKTALTQKYEQAGWNVSYNSNQRDGTSIKLKERKSNHDWRDGIYSGNDWYDR